MSFSAVLTIDGGNPEGYDVVSSMCMFSQTLDDKGRPSSGVRGGGMFIQVASTQDSKLVELMLDSFRKFNGEIRYKRMDSDSTAKVVSFEDAFCVQLTDLFSDTHPHTVMVTITARVIDNGGVKHINKW